MANSPDPDMDDDFSELYKEYTGPPGSNATNIQDKAKTNKRPQAGSDGEEEPHDPNAVPTDFTSREAKVWEAKSKATERNWKKRKEEEMICKICGESGHFTQVLLPLSSTLSGLLSLLEMHMCLYAYKGEKWTLRYCFWVVTGGRAIR